MKETQSKAKKEDFHRGLNNLLKFLKLGFEKSSHLNSKMSSFGQLDSKKQIQTKYKRRRCKSGPMLMVRA